MSIPDDRSYTDDHEWVMISPGASLPDTPVRVGITSVATESLGELVFVDLPEPGATVTVGQTCGEVESTKAISELYPPVSGCVTAVNGAVVDEPALISADPYGGGWLFEVQPAETAALLTAAQYADKNGVTL